MSIQVLLVEDDPFLRRGLAEYLEQEWGCTVRQAADREAVLRILEQHGPHIDVALIDQALGGDNGIDIMRLIKADFPWLPVIIFTGYGDVETGQHALRSGAYRYMEKPLKPEEVGLQVQLAAEHYRLVRERDIFGRLLEVSRALLRHTDLNSVLNTIAEKVRELTGFQQVLVSVVRDGKVYHRGIAGISEEEAEHIRRLVRNWKEHFGPFLRDAEAHGYKVGEYTYFIPEGALDLSQYGLEGQPGQRVCPREGENQVDVWHPQDMFGALVHGEEGHPLGLIWLESPENCKRPGPETIRVMDLLASLAALAISRVRQQEDLLESTARVHTATSQKEALDIIAEQAARLLNADAGGVLLLDRAREYLSFAGAYGLSEKIVKGTKEPVGTSIAGRVVKDGKPLISYDVPNDPRFENPAAAGEGLKSIISVPIWLEGEIIGTLDVQSKTRTYAFREEDIPLLNQLARHAAVAIDRVRFIDALRKVTHMARLVTQTVSDDPKGLLEPIVKNIGKIMEADCVVLYPFDVRVQKFDVERVAAWGLQQPDRFNPRDEVRGETNAVFYVLSHSKPPVMIEDMGDENNPEVSQFKERKFIRREGIKALIAAPLAVPESEDIPPLGVLFVNYRSPQKFTEWEKDIFRLIVSFGAVGLRAARSRERKRQELEALAEVVRVISDAEDVGKVWEQVLTIAAKVTQAEYGAFLMKDERADTLQTRYAHDIDVEAFRHADPMLAERGITRWVVENKRSALAVNLPDTWRDIYVEAIEGVQCELTVPILYGEEILGIIDLESPRPYAFSEEDRQFVENLANIAAITIHMARTHHRLERTLNILDTLFRATQGPEAIPTILEKARKAVSADFANIMLYNPFVHALKFTHYSPPGDYPALVDLEHRIPLGREGHERGITGRVFLTQQPALVPNVHQDEDYVDYTGETQSELAVPIFNDEGGCIGVLNVESRQMDTFREEDIETLTAFANRLGQILTARARQEKADAHFMAAKLGMINSTWIHEIRREVGRLRLELFTLKRRYEADLPPGLRGDLDGLERIIEDIMAEVPSPDTRVDETESVPIVALLRRMMPSITKKFSDVPWSLEVHVPEDTLVRTNPYWLRWTLRQLVENAAEAMSQQGEKRLTVRVTTRGESVIVEVEDNGPGIPEEVRKRLFREPIPTSPDAKGSGVALLLARTLLRGMGGDLDMLRTGPEGTVMAVLLPRVSPDKEDEQ